MLIANKIYISKEGEIVPLKYLEENEIVGSLSFDINEKINFSTLYNLSVDYNYRKKGFATKLRNEAIQRILGKKITKIHTNPQSYLREFTLEMLSSFYKKNFKVNGAYKIEERELYQGKLELIAFF